MEKENNQEETTDLVGIEEIREWWDENLIPFARMIVDDWKCAANARQNPMPTGGC